MKPTSDLFELIHSLSGAEKRYFKITSGRHVIGESNRYVKLFDLLLNQREYDETAVKQRLPGKTSTSFSSEKHYLYQAVLRSLCEFHSGRSALYRLHEQLNAIEILYDRGLSAQCARLVQKAKRDAYAFEKFHELLALMRWDTLLAIRKGSQDALAEMLDEMSRIYEIMRAQTSLMRLAFEIKRIVDSGKASTKVLAKRDQSLEKIKSEAQRKRAWSFLSEYYYLSGKAIIAFFKGQDKECLLIGLTLKKAFEQQPEMIREMSHLYAQNFYNLINIAVSLRWYSEALEWLSEQKQIFHNYKIRNAVLERAIFIFSHERELMIHYATGDLSGALRSAKSAEEGLRNPGAFGAELYELFLFLAIAQFSAGNARKAARWLNRILNPPEHIVIRTELGIHTRLLYLLVLAETQDRLYKNRVKATRRFLESAGVLSRYEHLLEAIQILSDYRKNPERSEEIDQLAADIKRKSRRGWTIGDFRLAPWVEHRRTGRSLESVLAGK